jgi:hypothetical protein
MTGATCIIGFDSAWTGKQGAICAPPAGWYENFITGFWAHADSRAEVGGWWWLGRGRLPDNC